MPFVQVDCMNEALQRSQDSSSAPNLKVSILLDHTRGSRGCLHFPRRPFCCWFAQSTVLINLNVFVWFSTQDR